MTPLHHHDSRRIRWTGQADPAREPLHAGHPLAWSILTDGTLLEGTAYPPYQAPTQTQRSLAGSV